jgi:malonate-semialdehyde dehydrogenase (acetylating)/methylmalonate-semialdehyde dehydrogenase
MVTQPSISQLNALLDKTDSAPALTTVNTVQNYIGGKWTPSLGKETVDILNPATKQLLGKTPLGTTQDVDTAVANAKEAFKTWRETPVIDRVQVLFKLKMLLEEHLDELARLCTLENGKTLSESYGDVRRGIQMVETACGMPTLMMGKSQEDIAAGIDCHAIRQPMGVFAAITPFNFPAMVPFWFWPYAIAAGNTFILKPSERVPLTQIRIFELIEKAGLPAGVMNMVHGGKEVVDALCSHPDVKGLSFVGSTPVAKHVYTLSSSHGKRVQALGGAKNFMVVLPDAVMDAAVRTVVESCTGCAGQRCLAGSVVVGVGDAYQAIEQHVVKAAQTIQVGNGLDAQTGIGPVISEAARERVKGLIQSAIDQGATVLVDGREGVDHLNGYFLRPTVLGNVTPEMKIAHEEVFGPVICLGKTKTLDEAIQWLNASPFGNTSSLFTTSGAAARKFSYEADPSMIGINIGVPAPMAFFSFGGKKDSFFGDVKAHGSASVEFYTDTKVTIERWIKESSIW